ncbi:lipopolysaccharide biosynthesis protein [Agromyces humi]|uniref:lipopolysaccharide biosynthesis protein n=1 Tax=Agromyces humi TaxID=1766800 RepID=UPI001356C332|nr:lipopolysaccharide biosynthesis protein [Agromyces humi]
MSPSLGASASRGAAVTLSGQLVRVLIQLCGIVILARLLTPADYGLVAMVTAIVGVAEIFRDFGLSAAAVQAKTLSRHQRDNLFWTNTAIGLVLSLTVLATSGLIAGLYDDPRLQSITAVLSVTFLLNGISTQYRADLNRNLSFFRLSLAEIGGQAAGVASGIVLAVLGFGYWALVAQQVVQAGLTVVLLVAFARWIPGWIHRGESIRSFIGFGASLFGSQLLGYAARNADSVVIGARFGPVDLGLYNRAFQLMMLPLLQINAPSTRVALPVLSRLQDQRERFAAFISFGQVAMLTIIGVAFAYLGAQAGSVIAVALGDQWVDATPIFQILLVAGFFQAANYAAYWVFLAKGLARSNFLYALATRPAMVVLIVIGSAWGVYGVAIAYTVSLALSWPVALIWIARVSDAPAGQLFRNGLRSLVVFGIAAGASFASTVALPEDAYVIRLAVGLAALVVALSLLALVWPTFRRDLIALAGARRYFAPSRGAGPDAATQGGES